MSKFKRIVLAAACLTTFTWPVWAQDGGGNASFPRPPRPDCTQGKARELDFWLGDWRVKHHATGQDFGINHFTRSIDGCAMLESFRATSRDGSAYLGTSLTFYDMSDSQWHQFYVDNGGRRSLYSGDMRNGEWVMVAPMSWPGRGPFLMRMIVRRNPDGSVRQLGAISVDNGATWRQTFDLDYIRLAEGAPG